MRGSQFALHAGHRFAQIVTGKITQTAGAHQRTLSGERGEVLFGQLVPLGGAVLTGQEQALRHRFGAGSLAVGRMSGHRGLSRGIR